MSRASNTRQLYVVGHTDGYLQAVADANVETKPEGLEQYFSREDTPSRNSPTGNTMVRILAKFPGISFDDARIKANELLNIAAKSRVYRGPVVLSAKELADRKERLARVFGQAGSPQQASTTTIPGVSRYSVNKDRRQSRGEPFTGQTEGLETAAFANSISTEGLS